LRPAGRQKRRARTRLLSRIRRRLKSGFQNQFIQRGQISTSVHPPPPPGENFLPENPFNSQARRKILAVWHPPC
jgi:hypothetical protein